jgi:hypothetical protein
MKTKSSKTKKHTPQLVERGFAIHQQLIILNDELKKIKDRIKTEASAYPAEHLPLLEKDSEGSQWIAKGDGCECRIVFPDPKTKTEFDPCTSDFLNIRSLAGDHLKTLFRKFSVYRPVDKKNFRGQVNNLLAPKAAKELLELCSSPSEPKAVFKSLPADKKLKKGSL